jgi:hypothetical protein
MPLQIPRSSIGRKCVIEIKDNCYRFLHAILSYH